MKKQMKRRDFLKVAAAGAGGALSLGGAAAAVPGAAPKVPGLVSPGCRGSKVKVARIYMGNPEGLWPKPDLDLRGEVRFYQNKFAEMKDEFSDVDFFVDELVTSPEQAGALSGRLKDADGILVIHLTLRVSPILEAILAVGRPTTVFAVPYSGHDWTRFGALRKQKLGEKMECLLTSDYHELAAAVRPFRAIHHLREARILDNTEDFSSEYADAVRKKFGTEIKLATRSQVLEAYDAVDDDRAKAEAERWIGGAVAVVEPSREEIFKSCKLALAFQEMLDRQQATVMTVDCYGSMYHQLPAFPCIGFTRLNDMGLGGICESDLQCAMTHILFQGLAGKPGFISDPTLDTSINSIILAHCLGSTRMDGPDKPACPYRIRSIMERREGAVPQVKMDLGRKVTQAILLGTDRMLYFTGEIIDTPDTDRGCRTKITVRVDGDAEKLWQNWTNGLHRVTCYGDISRELGQFCRFEGIELVNEAV
ncbi:MAG: hypothetical protein JXQ83_08300 [Candidatus Glassbacteria bacterium]|nr:hypothetical protein [Candidatus Glassbacteria bacterium]